MARGDHLFYFMGGGSYSHHGLDCGDGSVIHYELTPWEKLTEKFSLDPSQAKVNQTSLEEFSRGNEVLVRAYDEADDVELVMERGLSKVGTDGYSVYGNNCEHFVVWCKTGQARSSQVDAHKRAATAVATGAPIGFYLLRMSRRVPGPFRKYAMLGAVGVAGAVYLLTYMQNRVWHRRTGVS